MTHCIHDCILRDNKQEVYSISAPRLISTCNLSLYYMEEHPFTLGEITLKTLRLMQSCLIATLCVSCLRNSEAVLEAEIEPDQRIGGESTIIIAGDDGGEIMTGPEMMAGFDTITGVDAVAGIEVVAGSEMVAGIDVMTGAGVVAGVELAGIEAIAGVEAMAGVDAVAGVEAMAGDEMISGAEPLGAGPGDTDPLTACRVDLDYCPVARVSALSIPSTVNEATEVGCRLQGSGNGTALSSVLSLAGDFDTNDFVRPDDQGEIALIILNHLEGWGSGQTGNQSGELTSHFFLGDQLDDGTFSILDGQGESQFSFPETVIMDGLYQTPPGDFPFLLFLTEGFPLSLNLSSTKVSGLVSTDQVGFSMTEGLVQGYLTDDSIRAMLNNMYVICASDNAPDFCDTVGTILSGDVETDEQLLIPLLGGYDAQLVDDIATACSQGESCNAISVCLSIEMSSVTVSN